mgnify:CR=1 FL=1
MANVSGAGTMERVNMQLDKVDRVTDSAVDVADSVDTTVRAVTLALTRPVQKISGLAEGIPTPRASWRDAEITELQPAGRLDQDVAGLDVAVDEAARVRRVERGADLAHDRHGARELHRLAAAHVARRPEAEPDLDTAVVPAVQDADPADLAARDAPVHADVVEAPADDERPVRKQHAGILPEVHLGRCGGRPHVEA